MTEGVFVEPLSAIVTKIYKRHILYCPKETRILIFPVCSIVLLTRNLYICLLQLFIFLSSQYSFNGSWKEIDFCDCLAHSSMSLKPHAVLFLRKKTNNANYKVNYSTLNH